MNKSKVLNLAGASVALFLACAQPASARDFADIYTDCGLGALIAPNNGAVAAVTNVTWDSGTTAVSSDASSAESCKGGRRKTAALILDAYPQLERELAQGSGTHLTALFTAAGCNAQAHRGIAASLRTGLAASVAQPGYSTQTRYDQAQGLFNQLYERVDGEFAGACTGA
jgi:hypothetical protein